MFLRALERSPLTLLEYLQPWLWRVRALLRAHVEFKQLALDVPRNLAVQTRQQLAPRIEAQDRQELLHPSTAIFRRNLGVRNGCVFLGTPQNGGCPFGVPLKPPNMGYPKPEPKQVAELGNKNQGKRSENSWTGPASRSHNPAVLAPSRLEHVGVSQKKNGTLQLLGFLLGSLSTYPTNMFLPSSETLHMCCSTCIRVRQPARAPKPLQEQNRPQCCCKTCPASSRPWTKHMNSNFKS